jgi:hypothetical protein
MLLPKQVLLTLKPAWWPLPAIIKTQNHNRNVLWK